MVTDLLQIGAQQDLTMAVLLVPWIVTAARS